MGKRVDSGIVKKNIKNLTQYIPTELPSMGWYFSKKQPANCIVFEKNKWTCMFQYVEQVASGRELCFSSELTGCQGAACYLGFETPNKKAGSFLAQKEKFKNCVEYAEAFYNEIKAIKTTSKYLILGRIQDIPDEKSVEVVNLWINALSLSGLVTLTNYDRPTNNNVLIPFASGCQSIWTIPYKEKSNKKPKAVVGGMDPAMRKYISSEILLYSLPSERIVELTEYISSSFLTGKNWRNLFHNYK